MMSLPERRGMSLPLALLKGLFLMLFAAVGMAITVAGILDFPDPASAVMIGTGLLVILMLLTAGLIHTR